ncbi:MAG: hypothetical protein UT82_C0028G0015 [Parcubacteria group bacterium GW2011_GWB1_40_14]|nr:MAG: hypothetical protein UT82_C0028G0015 [Parcubacteria group bacterium GW2011_GWB1_40_14]
MKKQYYFSPDISYKAFKRVCDKFPDSGIVPLNIDKMLWQMLRERKINIGLRNSDDPIFISIKPMPKNASLITDPQRPVQNAKVALRKNRNRKKVR